MAHLAKLSALTDELVTLITSFSPQNEPNAFNTYRESALRSLRYHNNARTNKFDVASQLDGLDEKLRVYDQEALADALTSRLDELATRPAKWTPEILHLLLELSDKPVTKSKLRHLEALRAPDGAAEATLTWADLAADYDAREREIWRDIDYAAESEDEEEEEEDVSLDDLRSESVETRSTGLSVLEEPAGGLIADAVVPVDGVGLDRLLQAQFWKGPAAKDHASFRTSTTCRITELQVVREVLFMISGSPTSLFHDTGRAIEPVETFALDHASQHTFQAVLSDVAGTGSALSRLRSWIRKVEPVPLIQGLQSATEKRLRDFAKRVSDIQTTYVSPAADRVVSLLDVQSDLDQAARPLLELAQIIRELESEPYAHAFRYLELLYDRICMLDMTGDDENYAFMGRLFFDCFSVYLRPLRRWMDEGEVHPDDTVFFVAENAHEVEASLLWEEKYRLRKTRDGSLHAPRFLHTSADKIFTAGKSIVVLRKLNRFRAIRDAPPSIEPPLDFPSVCGGGAAGRTAFAERFDAAFERWIQSKHHAASSILRECLDHDCGLWTSLESLERLYFMTTPSLFPRAVFAKLDQLAPAWNDRFTLTELARTMLGSLGPIEAERLAVSVRPTACRDVRRDRQTVASLARIRLTYRLPWAIQMIVAPSAMTSYQEVHTLLLQTLRAESLLSALPARPRALFSTATATQLLHASLRTRLLWFTHLLAAHLTTNILRPRTAALRHALATAADIDDMKAAHASFARDLLAQSMLGAKLAPIHRTILSLLDMAVRWTDLQAAVRGDVVPPTDPGGRQSIDGAVRGSAPLNPRRSSPSLRPACERRSSQRWDSLSDSDDGESDSDSSTSSASATGRPKLSRTRASGAAKDQAGSATTAYEELKAMKKEFDGLIRFLREGLRAVARVGGEKSADAGREWDIFAEMIEEGSAFSRDS